MGGGQGLCHHLTTLRTVPQSQRVTCDRASIAPRLRNSELRVLPPTILLIHVKSTCHSAVWECQMPLESLSQFELETENGKEWTRCRVGFSQRGNCFAFQRQNLSLVCGLISVLKSLKSIFLSLHGIIPLFSEKELSVYIWGWRLLLFWSNYENQYNTNNCNHNTSFQVRGTKRQRLSRPTRSGHWNKKRRLHPIIHLTYKCSSFLIFARNFMLFSKTVYK